MKCAGCDVLLTDIEVVLKNKATGEFYDLCGDCLEAYKDALTEMEDDSGIIYQANWSTGLET
jgi:hypothetical protein